MQHAWQLLLRTYALPLAFAVFGGVLAAASIAWLWREYTLYAIPITILALSGGGIFLPRRESIRLVLLGIGTGLLVGSLLAMRSP